MSFGCHSHPSNHPINTENLSAIFGYYQISISTFITYFLIDYHYELAKLLTFSHLNNTFYCNYRLNGVEEMRV